MGRNISGRASYTTYWEYQWAETVHTGHAKRLCWLLQRLLILSVFSYWPRGRTSHKLWGRVSILKKVVVGTSNRGETSFVSSKLKVPEPKQFDRSRNAKELENFLWDIEQYFKAVRVVEEEQVTITSMYLTGDTKLWWRTRLDDDSNTGRPKIETWETLKKELKDQFLLQN